MCLLMCHHSLASISNYQRKSCFCPVSKPSEKKEFILINYHHKLYRLKPFINLDLRTHFKFIITYFYDFSKKMELGLRIKYE